MRWNEQEVALLYDRFTTATCVSFEPCSAPQISRTWAMEMLGSDSIREKTLLIMS